MKNSNNHLAVLLAWMLVIVGLFLAVKAIHGETRPPNFITGWQVVRQAVPTTATDVSALDTNIPANTDLYVCQLDLAIAPNSGVVNVSIYDKQSTAQYFMNAVPITSTTTTGTTWSNIIRTNQDQGCAEFKGGMVVLASGAGVTIYVSGKN